MAVRKTTVKEQMDAVLRGGILEPGEQPLAGLAVISGPSPWLAQGVLGLIGQMFMKYYFVEATDRRLIFIHTSWWTGRPKGFAFADPRGAGAVVAENPNPLWSWFRYRRPDGTELRINVHRMWRDEMMELMGVLRGSSAPAQPGSGSDGTAPPAPAS